MTWTAVSLAAAVTATAPPAVPEAPRPSSYALRWSAPASCPDQDAVARDIEALLESRGDAGEMSVHAEVEESAGQFTLRLTTEFMGVVDEREPVSSGRCADLSQTVALTVAIALDAGAAERAERRQRDDEPIVVAPPGEPTPTPTPEPAAEPTQPTEAPPPEVDETPSRMPTRVVGLSMHIAQGLTYGALPQVGGGNELAITLSWPRARLDVFGVYLWPQRNRSETGLFQSGTGGLRGCGRLFAGRVEFPLCGGAELGAIRADSRGLSPSNTVVSPWAAALAGAGIALRGERVGLWSLAEACVPFVVPQFLVGSTIAFRPAPVTLRVALGLEFFFR